MTDLPLLDNFVFPAPPQLDAERTIAIYETLRPILPKAVFAPNNRAERLIDILDKFDALILDGFGVINIGLEKIDGIDQLIERARKTGKIVTVLTNGASHPSSHIAQKYQDWQLDLKPHEIVSSRDALMATLNNLPSAGKYLALDGKITPPEITSLSIDDNEDWRQAEGFIMLGTSGWNDHDQAKLEACLQQRMRPVLVGNPDVSAPHPGQFSAEPGYWMAQAMQKTGLRPQWFGKPYPPAFELAVRQIHTLANKQIDYKRIAMVGDSLHTDILGGAAFGLSTVLVTGYGLLRDHDVDKVIMRTGIAPHWQVNRL